MKKIYFAFALLFISNCSGYRNPFLNKFLPLPHPKFSELSQEQITKMVEKEQSTRDEYMKYRAPVLSVKPYSMRNAVIVSSGPDIMLRGWKSISNKSVKAHQVYIKISYLDKDYRYYNYVTDSGEKILLTKWLNGDDEKGLRTELIEVEVLDSDLRLVKNEMTLVLTASSGKKELVKLPAKYIKAYLKKFDQ